MLLSIIIPCYNSEKFIKGTLDSLLKQITDDCEIILVNDGSQDNTGNILNEYSKLDFRIKVINKENEGVSIARNVGVLNSTGRYIAFLDSDDDYKNGTIDYFIKIISNIESEIYSFGYESRINNKISKTYKYENIDCKTVQKNDFIKLFLSKDINMHICSCIFERDFLIKNQLQFTPALKIGEDVEFLLNVLEKCQKKIFYSNRICYIYNIRNDSVMQGYKMYNDLIYHAYEVRRDKIESNFYQSTEFVKYANFWLQNQILSNIVMFLRSTCNDYKIKEKLVLQLKYMKNKIPFIRNINYFCIQVSKLLPLKLIIRYTKGKFGSAK